MFEATPLNIIFVLGLVVVACVLAAATVMREPKRRPPLNDYLSEPEILPGSIPCEVEPGVFRAEPTPIPQRPALQLCPNCRLGVLDGHGNCSICLTPRGAA